MKNIFTKRAFMPFIACACLAAVACNDNEDPQPSLKPETTQFNFTSGSYTKVLAVEAKHLTSFHADVVYSGSETDWVETPQVVEGGVKIAVKPNTASTPRSARLVLSAAGMQDVEVIISQKAQFSSELIGTYAPWIDAEASDYGLFIKTEWNENGAPSLMLGTTKIEWALVEMMVPMIVGASYYYQGLVDLELMDDGRIGVRYHPVTLKDGMNSILDPTFGKETLSFPDPVTLPVVPVDVMGYYTQGDKIYLSVDKRFISKMDPGTLDQPIVKMIDGMISKYGLALVSNNEVFALPLKYKVEGDMLTLYVDREMMLPFKQLLIDLLDQLLPSVAAAAQEGTGDGGLGIDPVALKKFVSDIFDNSTKFELGVKMTKKAQ